MSCINCDEKPIIGACYRWKNANVEIIACREHWLEVTEVLNKAQDKMKKVNYVTKIGGGRLLHKVS